jgi:hypothetical protein
MFAWPRASCRFRQFAYRQCAQESGQMAAQRTLLAALGPALLRVIRAVLGSKHPDVEDVLQEAMVGIHSALAGFRGESTITHFACRIALKTALKVRRYGLNVLPPKPGRNSRTRIHNRALFLARPAGLEPATSGLETHCSIQLSYGRRGVENGPKSDTDWSPCQGTASSCRVPQGLSIAAGLGQRPHGGHSPGGSHSVTKRWNCPTGTTYPCNPRRIHAGDVGPVVWYFCWPRCSRRSAA